MLDGLSAASPSDVWAVGGTGDIGGWPITIHWDGKAWSLVPSPTTSAHNGTWLRSVAAISTGDVWMVGGAQNGPFSLHWDGKNWTGATVPLQDDYGEEFFGSFVSVAAASPGDVWAVGGPRGPVPFGA